MAIIKRMSSKANVAKIEKYLKQEHKTECKLISGINCDSENFSRECQATNLLYNKNQNKNDRKYYHIIQSFSPLDNDKLTYEQAHKIGQEFAEKNFKGFEVMVVTHKDKEHIHNHFVVNSVSLETGKKYRADNKSLWQMRRDSNTLCKENGLTHSIQELDKRSKNKFKDGELQKEIKGEETWKSVLRAQIKNVLEHSKSLKEFFGELKEKYNVETQIRTKKSKGTEREIIEYKPPENRKFFDGEKRLGTEYGKDYIDGITRANAEQARTKDRRTPPGEPRRTAHSFGTPTVAASIREREIERISDNVKYGTIEREREQKEINRTEWEIEQRESGNPEASKRESRVGKEYSNNTERSR